MVGVEKSYKNRQQALGQIRTRKRKVHTIQMVTYSPTDGTKHKDMSETSETSETVGQWDTRHIKRYKYNYNGKKASCPI